jgi:hypothetical protein
MGFEPTTFCMASSAYAEPQLANSLQIARLRQAFGWPAVQEFRRISVGLDTE